MEDVEERTELQQRIHTQNHQHERTQSNHDTQHPAAQQAELEAIARRAVRDAQELRAREAAGRTQIEKIEKIQKLGSDMQCKQIDR